MFSDDAQPLSSRFDPPKSRPPFRMTLVELLWREWFETMSQVAYQRKEPASFFVQNGSPTNGRFGPFDLRSSHSASEGPNGRLTWTNLSDAYNR
jgi:hypothetical protein